MPFVKLDVRLLESTLWEDFDATRVFTAALLMAEPREFLGAVAALEIDQNRETGLVLPAGWYGFVPASGPGIVRRAMLDSDRGLAALKRLAADDPQSRSVEHDGRRIVRVDGGFIILNFMAYRERDMSGAERARRYRLRKSGKSVPPSDGLRQTPRKPARSTGLSTPSSTPDPAPDPEPERNPDEDQPSRVTDHDYVTKRHATVTKTRDITEADADADKPPSLSLPPGEEGDGGGKPPKPSRADGTNPRATGTNPRSAGTNPRARAPQGLEGGSTAPASAPRTKGRWWLTMAGIIAKGREVGIEARPGEDPQSFKHRVSERVEALQAQETP